MRELREGRGTSRTRRALRETSPFRPPTRSGNPGPRGDRDYIGRDLRERDREGPRGRGTTAAPNTLGRRNGNGYNGNYSASSSPRMGPGRGGPTRENFALVPAGGAPLELQRVLPPEYDALYEKGGGASALKHREEQFEGINCLVKKFRLRTRTTTTSRYKYRLKVKSHPQNFSSSAPYPQIPGSSRWTVIARRRSCCGFFTGMRSTTGSRSFARSASTSMTSFRCTPGSTSACGNSPTSSKTFYQTPGRGT